MPPSRTITLNGTAVLSETRKLRVNDMNLSNFKNSQFGIETASELVISVVIAMVTVFGFVSLNNLPMPV